MHQGQPHAREASAHAPRATWGKRAGPLRFLLLFLVYVGVFLTGGRLLAGTPVMDAYLFQVARHTAFLLDVLGESAAVENPVPLGKAASTARDEHETPWRSWQDRVQRVEEELEREARYLAMLPDGSVGNGADTEELVQSIRRRVEALAASAERQVPSGGEVFVGTPGLSEFLPQARQALAMAGEVLAQETLQLEPEKLGTFAGDVEDMVQRQRAFLAGRVAEYEAKRDGLGPLVYFVARPETRDVPARRFQFTVVAECGALPSMSVLLAAILAFPAGWRARLWGVLAGIPLLYTVNLCRLVCLGFIGAYAGAGAWFDFAHEYVWQGIYLVFVALVWLAWVEFLVRRAPVSAHDEAAQDAGNTP